MGGAGLSDKKSSNQQQRGEKSQEWRKRKNHITMSPETHTSIEQTRSENSEPTPEMAESKEKVQLKGTELKQLRKLECNKEETSKIAELQKEIEKQEKKRARLIEETHRLQTIEEERRRK